MASKGRLRKKSRFSKKSKKAWRITDIKDVEDFYEDQLLEERLGGPFSEKPDEELFFIQKDPKEEPDVTEKQKVRRSTRQEKKKRALEPPKCFMILENTSKVPDPISKRNTVRTKEERKSNIQKDIEEKLRKRGVLKRKEILAAKNRLLNKKRAAKKNDPYNFSKDVWENEIRDEAKTEWLDGDTVRHYVTNTGKLEVKTPKSIQKKPSALPNIENPHPGVSYNPAPNDHNHLLQIVADKELKLIKEEKHLDRVTSAKFSKITREEAMNNWLAEMSQGLINDDDGNNENEEDTDEYKPVNPPALLKRKPLKKKKKAKLLRQEEFEKQKQRVEKKKIADLYKLRFMEREILRGEEKSAVLQEKRKINKVEGLTKTKKLGPKKFSEPLPEFKRPHELKKNLRSLNPEGSILTDRFYSLQKRNIIEPRVRARQKKAKVKKFFKAGHKLDDLEKL
ncbi:ribosome biogenesis protein NOP53 [Lycorma delicatula]|uniref:ribosome biogenesis protein NOP53 n=1 Tax=Lycorma delicatula TaxID=130591 RepID=UPI003F51897C